MTFSFDDQFTMFDVTPVDNQFILEQLPGARGDYVKVYLYGLLYCYHPKEEANLDNMARDLDMTREEIMAAYRYWERHKVVRRISDNPPAWQYINFRQRTFASDDDTDPEYIRFSQDVERSFDGVRSFRGSEIAEAYEWKDSMQLPAEVIIMILSHMVRTRGKSFRISDAQKLAVKLAEENARTEDEAAEILSRDESASANMRKILRKLGKRYSPSDANMSLYMKWTREWGFSQEAIEEACDQTGTSDPSLALVDSILKKTFETQSFGQNKTLGRETVRKSSDRHDQAKKVMHQLGRNGSVTAYQEEIYNRMADLYPFEIIMSAARECSRKKKDPESVLKLLESWKKRGFTHLEEVEEHIRQFHDREDFIRKIRSRWPVRETEPGERSLEMLAEWEESLGLSRELILKAADYASEAKNPMNYTDRLLRRYAEKGIHTPEEAEKDRTEFAAQYRDLSKAIPQKSGGNSGYEQRDYSGEQDAALERMMNDTWGMKMREDLILELEAEFAGRRASDERAETARKDNIRMNYPDIDRLVLERENLIHGTIRGILNRKETRKDIPARMEELNQEIRHSLRNAGLPEDYLAPVRQCTACNDTGFVGYPIKEPCECFKKAYQQKIRERIGLGGGIRETFEAFDSSFIPDTPIPEKNFSQRQMTEKARSMCERWANQYPDVPYRNVLLTGKSGLGKTFLMHAMANRMIERGLNVLVISAYQFVESARKSYFDQEDSMDELMNVPILMMDDLGSEPLIRNITVELLFNLVNERMIRGRATVFSTNLKLEELRERYTERIVSRISDPSTSLVIALEGKDLRRVGV